MLNPRLSTPQATKDDRAVLWWEEIQSGVCGANEDGVAARRSECCPCRGSGELLGGKGSPSAPHSAPAVALGTAAINQAIKEGKATQTLRVLRNPDVVLRGVVDACAAAYQEQLAALAATKRQAGKAWGKQNPPGGDEVLGCIPAPRGMGSWGASLPQEPRGGPPAALRRCAGNTKPRWVQHRLQDGAEYFLSLQTFEGSWEWPCDGELCTTHLSREEIQVRGAQGRAGAGGAIGL